MHTLAPPPLNVTVHVPLRVQVCVHTCNPVAVGLTGRGEDSALADTTIQCGSQTVGRVGAGFLALSHRRPQPRGPALPWSPAGPGATWHRMRPHVGGTAGLVWGSGNQDRAPRQPSTG